MAQILIFLIINSLVYADFNVKSLKELKYQETIKQNYEESCGVSALATLLNLDGNNFSENDLIKEINDTNAVSLFVLEQISKRLGYKSKSYKIDGKTLDALKYPIIARVARDINYPHFVVIKVNKNYILVLDPNYGKYVLSKNNFMKIWTKYIFVVLPKNNFKKIQTISLSKFSYLLDVK